MERAEILDWLRETDPDRLETLWAKADRTRLEQVGDAVWLRGLIEVSNVCVRSCAYCGIAACAPGFPRYRMTKEEILDCAERAKTFGFGTVVMQAGEDPGITGPWMAEVIASIKARTGLAITLSLGEREPEELTAWKAAGADRYLLRFETSDGALYEAIHPSRKGGTACDLKSPRPPFDPHAGIEQSPIPASAMPGGISDRFRQLMAMRDLGFEIGTGVMVGIPGQTFETLATDIETFRHYDMDMIGIGPFVESPGTPLAGALGEGLRVQAGTEQVPNTDLMTFKVVALTRLICPQTNIPSTTALATINPSEGRAHGLRRGANVVMPNLTPPRYRELYQIYPGKAGLHETADITREKIERQILALGRTIGQGPGTSPRIAQRRNG